MAHSSTFGPTGRLIQLSERPHSPREPLNGFKAGEIQVKTEQAAVGEEGRTVLTWQVLFSSDSSGPGKKYN